MANPWKDKKTGQFRNKPGGRIRGASPETQALTVKEHLRRLYNPGAYARGIAALALAGDADAIRKMEAANSDRLGTESKLNTEVFTDDELRVLGALHRKGSGEPPLSTDAELFDRINNRVTVDEEDEEEEVPEEEEPLPLGRVPTLMISEHPVPEPLHLDGVYLVAATPKPAPVKPPPPPKKEPEPEPGAPVLTLSPGGSRLRMENKGTGIFGGYDDPREKNYDMRDFHPTPEQKKRTH
jgi:hypothetical protein